MRRFIECCRCRKRERLERAARADWNAVFARGACVGYVCPECQTAEEWTGAEADARTLDYGVAADGRAGCVPKA